ncbi:MFS transporter [Brevundimonas sp.]|uniref:MFS transporter n=1 Tax=Brevundimonas sp. TaxID=1871086 RepID=UPI002ABA7D43|nr:MFS transporter [Brevundimonas sp.]MDZ4363123.1 MFS transporter [Brevundimonas sp.]
MSSAPPTASDDHGLARASAPFILGYTGAQIGAFIAFIPLLTLLLPLKAEAIDPAGKAALLGQVALWGSVAAGLSNIVVGAASDLTRRRFGGRWPWILAGLVATLVCYGLIYRADTPTSLLVAVILLQLSLNLMVNPLMAVLADHIPSNQKGLVSGFTGLAYPLATLFGALVLGVWLQTEESRLWAVVAGMSLLITPFIVMAGRRRRVAAPLPPVERVWSMVALRDRDFLVAFLSRFAVQTAVAMNVLYLLFFLQQETAIATVWPDQRPEAVLGWLIAAATGTSIVTGLIGGYLSDRLARRRIFVLIGGLTVAAGALTMAVFPAWPGPLVGQVLFGMGAGLYGIVDNALIAEVLPSRGNAGRDLGVMNIAITSAQVVAPLVGLATLAVAGGDLRLVFAAAAVFAVYGAVSIRAVRRVA